jgi:hypothetical protein
MNLRLSNRRASRETSEDDAELFFEELVGPAHAGEGGTEDTFGEWGDAVTDREVAQADIFFAELSGEPVEALSHREDAGAETAYEAEPRGSACSAAQQQKINAAWARAKAAHEIGLRTLSVRLQRRLNGDVLEAAGLFARVQGPDVDKRWQEGQLKVLERAKRVFDGAAPASQCVAGGSLGIVQREPVQAKYDGTALRVAATWFDLPAELPAWDSRAGRLLRAIYTYAMEQIAPRFDDPKAAVDAAPWASRSFAVAVMQLAEIGGAGPDGKVISFEEALKEGANVLHSAAFGLAGGNAAGPDSRDGYDARDFDEAPAPTDNFDIKIEPRGTLIAKISRRSAWGAFANLVENVKNRADVPKAGGGTTKWSFDCFEFVIVNVIYGYWRTLSRADFNAKFHAPVDLKIDFGPDEGKTISKMQPLTLGHNADQRGMTHLKWEAIIKADGPGDKPFRQGNLTADFKIPKIPVGKTWDQLLREAPIGAQVIWTNKDTKAQCAKDMNLSFCAFINENALKVGPDEYSAHPFGIVSAKKIIDEISAAPFGGDQRRVKPDYVQKNVFISALRHLKR